MNEEANKVEIKRKVKCRVCGNNRHTLTGYILPPSDKRCECWKPVNATIRIDTVLQDWLVELQLRIQTLETKVAYLTPGSSQTDIEK